MKIFGASEEGFDCVTFSGFAARHRWAEVSDFMADRNDCSKFHVALDETIAPVCGSMGPPPDGQAIAHETISLLDMVADARRWDGPTRLFHHRVQATLRTPGARLPRARQVLDAVRAAELVRHSALRIPRSALK